jgi:hypothetical protein
MAEMSRKKIIREAALAGLIGGAALAAGQTLVAAATGLAPGAPWQLAASLAMGEDVAGRLNWGIFLLGAFIHFGLATVFGALFGMVVATISRPVRNNISLELAGGALYGLVIWAINQQVVGRLLYPWYLDFNPAVQALVHALFYGVPMATWLALRLRDVEVAGVHEARHRYQTSTGDEEYLRLRQWQVHNRAENETLGSRVPPEGERPGGPTIH